MTCSVTAGANDDEMQGSSHSGSQHDGSVLLKPTLLLLLVTRDSEAVDLQTSLKSRYTHISLSTF